MYQCGFVVDKATVELAFLQARHFPYQFTYQSTMLHTYLSSGTGAVGTSVAAVPRDLFSSHYCS